jgi:3-deoxy-7-phosphoheptulonate synthase
VVVVMAPDATEADIEQIVDLVRHAGGEAFVSRGVTRTIVGLVGEVDTFGALNLRSRSGVSDVVRISVPYKLVSREHHRARSVIRVGGVPIGPGTLTLIAGPCTVETPEQTLAAARMARAAGAALLRGGAFKPRTSPYAFQGLGETGLKILTEVRAETGLPVVTEVIDPASVDLVCSYADMLQIGTRSMQNFALLQAVGSAGKPVLLKRGMNATIEEWLMAAEYIAQRGNLDIVLCERGIRTFETATRNTLDISAVPVAQRLSHLPVIVDPSHSGGRRDLVLPLSRAAIAAGADGLIVDVHPRPDEALCDGDQALAGDDIRELGLVAATLPQAVGRSLAPAPAVPEPGAPAADAPGVAGAAAASAEGTGAAAASAEVANAAAATVTGACPV